MRRQALGLIETRGYAPLVMAVDGAIKAAQVTLTTKTVVGGGLVNATVRGEVGAVRAALDAAAAIIRQMGAQGMTHVIARPDAAIWALLEKDGLRVNDPDPGGGPAGTAGPPTIRPETEVPVLKSVSEPPIARAEPELPVVKPESEVPATKPEARMPVVQHNGQTPTLKDEGMKPDQKKTDGQSAPKASGKPKKPRKPAKK
jgi:Carbon dioxide concentrating mechanism/carboxysome shell protein